MSKLQLIGLFVLKIVFGLVVYYIYMYHYAPTDSYLYFEGSKNIFDSFLGNSTNEVLGWNASFDDVFYNNSRIIIYINFFIQFISFNNVFVHILFFCFFSFIGLTALYKAFYKYFPDKKNILIVGLYLVPSVLFWTSGIYKETIALCCLGLIIYLTDFGLIKSFAFKIIFPLSVLILLLFFIKIYIFLALIPLLLINWLASKMNSRKYLLYYALIFISLIAIVHLISKTSNKLNAYQLIADKQAKAISEAKGGIFLMSQSNFVCVDYNDSISLVSGPDSCYFIRPGSRYLSWELDNMKDTTFVNNSADSATYIILYTIKPANSVVNTKKLEPNFISVYSSIPFAIANVFFQPTLFSIKNVLQLFSWIENMWLLLLIVMAILFFDKKITLQKEVLIFCILFALIQFALIGLTTPVVGAMVRYKVTALPFLFTICMLCIDSEKLSKKLKRTKN
ncbi:MAG TPA: hypothetical protein VJI69_01560 [Bacteroidia bacterium]|nr:hypothetical protein [Bacteroidia bacterium]